MLELIRRTIVLPRTGLDTIAAVAAVSAFLWLLTEGLVQPIAVLLLELYLTF